MQTGCSRPPAYPTPLLSIQYLCALPTPLRAAQLVRGAGIQPGVHAHRCPWRFSASFNDHWLSLDASNKWRCTAAPRAAGPDLSARHVRMGCACARYRGEKCASLWHTGPPSCCALVGLQSSLESLQWQGLHHCAAAIRGWVVGIAECRVDAGCPGAPGSQNLPCIVGLPSSLVWNTLNVNRPTNSRMNAENTRANTVNTRRPAA